MSFILGTADPLPGIDDDLSTTMVARAIERHRRDSCADGDACTCAVRVNLTTHRTIVGEVDVDDRPIGVTEIRLAVCTVHHRTRKEST